ncbi:MAG TPA: nucleotidyltransferase domain-containing protein [Tepidisphaeraceae bacterium]|nr:nucleotidyltransferase domain-containing protein [Tepidisphaeraceae bacterium]
MPSIIERHLAEIQQLCRRHGVGQLDLFGSAARGQFDPATSDYDFLVEFLDHGYLGSSDRYFGLLHGLEDLLNRPVDLVDRSAVENQVFLSVAEQHIERLYDHAPAAKAS